MNTYQPNLFKKTLGFWAIFMALYLLYKYFPNPVFAFFCGITESNFQHYKAAFYAWIFLSAFEFALYRNQLGNLETWFYSRMATATLLPWIVFLIWYLGPAFYGRMPSIPLEIVYANLVTVLIAFMGAIFERGLAQIRYFKELKAVLWTLFLASVALYTIFTFVKLPWADVFIEPNWK